MVTRNERRLKRYQQLRDAGFNSYEANAIKDFRQLDINYLCSLKQYHEKALINKIKEYLGYEINSKK